jgi:asparagine synthase (glutamine-hydrolysing)
MCGICGILHHDQSRPVDATALRRMAFTLRHRGPDGEGTHVDGSFGCAHRRLSIIDLSPAGAQPMTNEDGRYWITFNGEIYNYLELRDGLVSRGHRFRSHTDTEVLLKAYLQYGTDCPRHFRGMFAFAIWDARERRLFAARDRFGIKPFYFAARRETFAFASEIKALLLDDAGVALDPRGLADYLTFQFCLGDKTLFRDVRKLLPAHTLTVEPGGEVRVERYWDLDFTVDTYHTDEYFRAELRRLLDDAIRLQLRSDVPVGAHLSGGLDSSTVACLAAGRLDAPLHTFTGGFRDGPQYDETSFAREVVRQLGAIGHEVYPSPEDFVRVMPTLMYHMDEPAAGPGLFPQYAVSELASQHVKVVLGGQGGDEIFAGYARYLVAYLEQCIRGGIEGTYEAQPYVVTFESILPNLAQLQGYQPMLRQFWRDGLFEDPTRRYFRLVDRSDELRRIVCADAFQASDGYDPFDAFVEVFEAGDTRSYINQMTRFDLQTLLPALLQVEDRTSMAVSLESRVPLLDHRIVELVASMPPMIKFTGGRTKHIFREVVRDIVPEAVHARQDKMGFPVPLTEWLTRSPVRDFVGDTLLGARSRGRGLFDVSRVETLLRGESRFARNVWGMLCLELWMQTHVDGPR